MALDVTDLQAFYDTRLGQQCQRRVQQIVHKVWPDMKNQFLLGLGYPFPYLKSYEAEAERVCVMMNAPQGVIYWPEEQKNRTALIQYDSIPLPDRCVDRILMIHSLEHAECASDYLREVWRVLKDRGRLLVITPNRRSIWTQMEEAPFGYGNSYTLSQLSDLLREMRFTPLQSLQGLYIFPTYHRYFYRTFPMLDRIGPLFFTKFSGIVAVEAVKQVYAGMLVKDKKSLTAAFIRTRIAQTPG